MKLSYSIEAQGGTIYIWDDATDKILHVIENKKELKALLDVLSDLYKNL